MSSPEVITGKRKREESSDEETSSGECDEKVDRYLLKCLRALARHVNSVHSFDSFNSVLIKDNIIKIKDENDCDIDIVEHNIKHESESLADLSHKIYRLKKHTYEFELLCKIRNKKVKDLTLNNKFDIYKDIHNSLRVSVVSHLTTSADQLLDQICSLINFYTQADYEQSAKSIRKCFSKIYKTINAIPEEIKQLKCEPDNINDSFSFSGQKQLSDTENAYILETAILSQKLSRVIKKLAKLKKIYKTFISLMPPELKPDTSSTNVDNNDDCISPTKKKKHGTADAENSGEESYSHLIVGKTEKNKRPVSDYTIQKMKKPKPIEELDVDLDNLIQSLSIKKSATNAEAQPSTSKPKTNQYSADLVEALRRGDVEIDSDDEDPVFGENFSKILKNCNLTEEETTMYLKEMLGVVKEKNRVDEDHLIKINNLFIWIDFDVPPSHMVERNLSGGLNREIFEEVTKLGVKMKLPFTEKEDRQIRRNWARFCRVHNIPDDPTPFFVFTHDSKQMLPFVERRKFVQYMARKLPHRCLSSVYRRFKTIFRDKRTKFGAFTPEEDQMILTFVKRMGTKRLRFQPLVPILHRLRNSINARWLYLVNRVPGQYEFKVNWTHELKTKLVLGLLKEFKSDDIEVLRNAHVPAKVFRKIGLQMNLPGEKLESHYRFKLYTQMFASRPICLDILRVELLKIIDELGYKEWKRVDWKYIAGKYFPGFSHSYMLLLVDDCLKHVPHRRIVNLKSCMEYLKENYVEELKNRKSFGKRIICRLRLLKNKTLEEYI